MMQQDSSHFSQPETPSQARSRPMSSDESGPSFFPVTGSITFKPLAAAPKRETWYLPTGVARIVSAIGLSAALLWPLSSCSNPCSKPTTINSGNGQGGIGSTSNSCSIGG